jgi:hypothetical protein
MLSLPPSVRIFVCLVPADLRCGFDQLAHFPFDRQITLRQTVC